MSKAPEREIVDALRADTVFTSTFKAVLEDPAEQAKSAPFAVVQLIGDPNEKRFLSVYGGQARVQIDIYARERDPGLRGVLKSALRRLRGATGGIEIIAVRVANETSAPLTSAGLYRYTVDAEIDYTT